MSSSEHRAYQLWHGDDKPALLAFIREQDARFQRVMRQEHPHLALRNPTPPPSPKLPRKRPMRRLPSSSLIEEPPEVLTRAKRLTKSRTFGPPIALVARKTGVTAPQIVGRSKSREAVWARHAVFYLLSRAGVSLSAIGRAFVFDHTTVLSGIRAHIKRTGARRAIIPDVDNISGELTGFAGTDGRAAQAN